MNSPSPDGPGTDTRHPEVLVAPLVTFLAVMALLAVARWWDALPVHPAGCRFEKAFDIPCPGCGGTRSFRALSRGDVADAFRFHPAAILGVGASFVWLIHGAIRYFRRQKPHRPEMTRRRLSRAVLITLGLLLANWIYLLLYRT